MTRHSPEALASLIAVNVTPIAGMLFLGWPAAGVLISYFVDTLVGFVAVILLLMLHVTGDEQNTPIAGGKRWAKLAAGVVFLSALLLLPLALPLLFVLGTDVVADPLAESSAFRLGLAVQVLMSVLAVMRLHRELRATSDDDRILSARFMFLAARWILVFVTVATGLVPALGARVGAFVLIALYAGASIWFELSPSTPSSSCAGPRRSRSPTSRIWIHAWREGAMGDEPAHRSSAGPSSAPEHYDGNEMSASRTKRT